MSNDSPILQPPYDPKTVYDVPLRSIFADDTFNCRGVIDPTEVMELARSIRDRGLDLPVTVQPWTKPSDPEIKFRLVAGYRRRMAFVLNKSETIPALIRDKLTDIDARILNLTENIQRTELNILQEARTIEFLKDANMGQEEIARRVGKSRGWVQDRVYLLELPDEIQLEAAAGVISTKDIRRIWSLPSTQQQYEYVKQLKDAKALGTKREKKVAKLKAKNEKRLRTVTEIEELQDLIRDLLGNSLTTVGLGWVAGYVSDLEMHQAIADKARESGKFYPIPEGLSGRAKVTPRNPNATVAANAAAVIGLPWTDGAVAHVADDFDDDSDLDALREPDPEDQQRGQQTDTIAGV